MRPLRIVNDPGLKNLLGFVEPGYTLPLRTHVTSVVRNRHEEGKAVLVKMLEETEFVAVTTAGWSSKAVQSYATYTLHFLMEKWELASFVAATRPLDGSRTADNIA
eukprot:scpid56900/ scgid26932/ 